MTWGKKQTHSKPVSKGPGPGLFSDIGKKAREILFKDCSSESNLSSTTHTGDGLALTTTALQKERLSVGDVAVQYKDKNEILEYKTDLQSIGATTFTLIDIIPSTKLIASKNLSDDNSGKLEVQYFHEEFGASVSLPWSSPVVDISATFGTPTTAVGVEAAYDASTGNLTKYNVGLSMTYLDFCTSVILADKGDLLTASHVINFNSRTSTATEITTRLSKDGQDTTISVGGSYAVDDSTVVKLKLNGQRKVGILMQHKFKPKSVLTLSSEFDYNARNTNPKLGLSLALMT